MAERFGLGDVLSEIGALGKAHLGLSLACAAAIAAFYCALDFLVADGVSAAASLLVMVFAQYAFLERVLADRLPEARPPRRYAALFVSGLLGGLGIFAGLICLIIPGLVLLAGWSAASPFVVVAGKSGAESLTASWRATRDVRLPLALLLGGFWAVILAGVFALVYWSEPAETSSVAEIVAANALTSVSSVGGWLIGAAIFRLAAPRQGDLQSVFA